LMDFQHYVDVLRPRTIMLENVPGLSTDHRFFSFIKRMEGLGYAGEYRILNAANYGVPQRRRRLIYLAGKGMKIPFADSLHELITVRKTISGLPKAGISGDPIHDLKEKRTPKVINLIKRIPKDGGSRTDLSKKFQLDCHKRCSGFKDIYGRMAWDKVAPTITSGCFNPSKGRFLHPEENRAITMREAALLQGFPPNYKFPTTENKAAIALMIGNALPPPFIYFHAAKIRQVLKMRLRGDNAKH
jgi:DNA (cytosine-5)-methyltransferase 1